MRKPFDGEYNLTQGFGQNPADYAKFGLKGHNGLDYGLPSHTPVLAPHAGTIIEAASDPPGYGNYLKVGNDSEGSVLAHLLSFTVAVGDHVQEGQLIGYSDNTGNSTGPHLHWGYYLMPRDRQNGYAGFIDQSGLISTPSEPTFIFTDQTKIPLFLTTPKETYGEVELQELKAKLTAKDTALAVPPPAPVMVPVAPTFKSTLGQALYKLALQCG